jgi:hypothetical protein
MSHLTAPCSAEYAERGVRLAELFGTLSLATDLGMGQPMEHALRSCLLAVRFGASLGLDDRALRELYYVALLRRIGCTGDSHELQLLFGDDLAPHAKLFSLDSGQPLELMADILRNAGAGRGSLDRLRTVTSALASGPAVRRRLFRASCEVARQLAELLGFATAEGDPLEQTFERWDGRGFPNAVEGEALALAVRIAQLAAPGELGDIPSSGKKLAISGLSIYRVAAGKIVEGWVQDDTFQQLAPAPV